MPLNGTELVRLYTTNRVFMTPTSTLPGQGGYIYQEDINSGTVNITANTGTAVLWNAPDLAPKINYIPTSIGSKNIITFFDVAGTAYLYPVTIVPLTGNIINFQNQLYTNFMSLSVYDSDLGWLGF
jgi:hypothetical protein